MKRLLLTGLFLLLGFSQAFAVVTHIVAQQLTVGGTVQNGLQNKGTPMAGYSIPAGQTITSDSVYETGSQSFGYSALAIQATALSGISPAIKVTYQTSYDNVNWFSPQTTSGGTLTSVVTLATSIPAGNTWIVYNYTVYPYTRFNLQNPTATTDSVTAETMWQDYV